ncbi:MAG: hypothetical protein IJX96_04495 [Clostridia bacterium]|nr:hypothetical protein [Clostridia bacterium]
MSNAKTAKKPVKTTGLQYLLCAVCAAMQILFFLMFLNGFCTVDGTKVYLETFITFIVAFFEIGQGLTVYNALSYCTQGIMYLVFGILLIKNSIVAFSHLGNPQYRVAWQKQGFTDSFKYCVQYVILASLINSVRFDVMVELLLSSGCIVFVAVKFCDYLFAEKKPAIGYILSKVGYKIIELAICFLLASLVLHNCVENAWNGIGLLFQVLGNAGESGVNGSALIYLLYQYVIREVMLGSLAFMYFNIITQTLSFDDGLYEAGWKSFMFTAIGVLVVDIVIYIGLFTQGSDISVVQRALDYIHTVKGGTFSLVILGIAGQLTTYFPEFQKYVVKKAEEAPAAFASVSDEVETEIVTAEQTDETEEAEEKIE